jgi:hypothetical protein
LGGGVCRNYWCGAPYLFNNFLLHSRPQPKPLLMRNYYYHDGQAQHGPFTLSELKSKNIAPTTPVWFEGLNDWTPASQVDEVNTFLFVSIPPPFKKQTPPPISQNAQPSYEELFNSPKNNKKPLIIGTVALGALVLLLVFYFQNSSSASSPEVSFLDTSAQYANDKRRLDSLEYIETVRQAQNAALTKRNREFRNNWSKYITFQTNSYKVDSWGGISDLAISVYNETDKIVDEVVVTVDYYKSDGGLYETKEIPLHNIQSNTLETVQVPNTTRGTRIETAITKITSRSLHFCYNRQLEEGLVESSDDVRERNSEDPWFCK